MSPVSSMAFINAKIRARRSFLITAEEYRALASAPSLQEMLLLLGRNPMFPNAERYRLLQAWEVEQALLRIEVTALQSLVRRMAGIRKQLLEVYLEQVDIHRLKQTIRLWKTGGDRSTLMREYAVWDFPIDDMLDSEKPADFATGLKGTPFFETVAGRLLSREENHFELEMALDRLGFQRVWDISDALPGRDRILVRRLTGVEADLWNLNSLHRHRKFFSMPASRIADAMIPFGHWLSDEDRKRISAGAVPDVIQKRTGMAASPREESAWKTMETMLYRILVENARHGFAAFPFSAGSIVGYVALLRIQTRNVRTLIMAKQYGLSPESISDQLID